MSLHSIGLTPLIEAIESGDGEWEEAEMRWIAYYRASGARLWNTTDGGDGLLNWGTPETRSAQSRKREAALTSEQRATREHRRQSSLTPEGRRAIAIRREANKTPEDRSARARHAALVLSSRQTPDQRRTQMENLLAKNALRTPEQHRDAAKKRLANMAPERRVAIANKTWATRRVNAAIQAQRAQG
jgi:hypothetical protein